MAAAAVAMILTLKDWVNGYDIGRRKHSVSVGPWDLREPGVGTA